LLSEGFITQTEGTEICAKMHQIVQIPEIAHLYEKKPNRLIFNERDLLVKPKHYQDINRVIRPDRVVIDTDTNIVYIVDYKTGMPNESHQTQITNYATQFMEMGYAEVQKILIYTELGRVNFC
jgi:hypothetical protein